MNRNWYLICTAQNKENKVASLLNKKGIESFCPVTATAVKISGSKSATQIRPLFASFVFAYITTEEISTVKKTAYVSNLAYWKSKPAIISQQEINAVKSITENYSKISLTKTAVNTSAPLNVIANNTTTISNNMATVIHNGVTVALPSLGFTLVAERTAAPVIVNQPAKVSFAKKVMASVFFGF